MERVTIEDVAVATGVSRTTVSHVFSGHRHVSAKTRDLVESVARDLGYSPNHLAQSLYRGRTETIMIVVPDITNAFYPELSRGVQDVVSPVGYHALIANSDAVEERERGFLDDALTRRVDGVVFVGFRVPAEELKRVVKAGTAVVNIGETPRGAKVDSVRFDDTAASREAALYLLKRYGRRVAMISGDQDTAVGRERRSGFELALQQRDVRVRESSVVVSEFTRAGGAAGMAELLGGRRPPRAVLCANDLIAFGALEVAREANLAVPDDIAIMGHDDIEAASIVTPQLTTTRTDARELGRRAGELLMSRMAGDYDGRGRHVVVPHTLVVRDSA
jgi:LacI family transcriptional regulator